jgi:hypothetical protein
MSVLNTQMGSFESQTDARAPIRIFTNRFGVFPTGRKPRQNFYVQAT